MPKDTFLAATTQRKRKRVFEETTVRWRGSPCGPGASVDFVGDSAVVIQWLNAACRINSAYYRARVRTIVDQLSHAWQQCHAWPAELGGQWWRHTLREGNADADEMATEGMLRQRSFLEANLQDFRPSRVQLTRLVASFDGGRRGKLAAAGWHIKGRDQDGTWRTLLRGSHFCPGASAMDAELTGAELVLKHVLLLTQAIKECSRDPSGSASIDWQCPLSLCGGG